MAESHPQSTILACVIIVSDRCRRGEIEDLSGPLTARLFADYGIDASLLLVPDELETIQEAIVPASKEGARLVFTTDGTDLAPRDVTPEATEALLSTRVHGLEDVMCRAGEGHAPAAALSHGLVGVASRAPGGVFVVNTPGSSGRVKDAVGVIDPLAAHILGQLTGGNHPH